MMMKSKVEATEDSDDLFIKIPDAALKELDLEAGDLVDIDINIYRDMIISKRDDNEI